LVGQTALPFALPLGICSIESKVRILRPWCVLKDAIFSRMKDPSG
jgi:hypothetical protein